MHYRLEVLVSRGKTGLAYDFAFQKTSEMYFIFTQTSLNSAESRLGTTYMRANGEDEGRRPTGTWNVKDCHFQCL